ncbi:hypothetical protein A0H81_02971 [Grifola frondosa]|uniref:Uncharacterized protein n=1 Tax=Grifola frondosa TaxID=5627 RepID=A0A1C7MIM9_GRIFR|nr:hypothetical protein A0H81_02971 [Grifola frondosa]
MCVGPIEFNSAQIFERQEHTDPSAWLSAVECYLVLTVRASWTSARKIKPPPALNILQRAGDKPSGQHSAGTRLNG